MSSATLGAMCWKLWDIVRIITDILTAHTYRCNRGCYSGGNFGLYFTRQHYCPRHRLLVWHLCRRLYACSHRWLVLAPGNKKRCPPALLSAFVSILGFVFLHVAESEPFGISMALFGKPALLPFPWTHVDPLFYALPVSALVYIIVSLCTKPPAADHLERTFS